MIVLIITMLAVSSLISGIILLLSEPSESLTIAGVIVGVLTGVTAVVTALVVGQTNPIQALLPPAAVIVAFAVGAVIPVIKRAKKPKQPQQP